MRMKESNIENRERNYHWADIFKERKTKIMFVLLAVRETSLCLHCSELRDMRILLALRDHLNICANTHAGHHATDQLKLLPLAEWRCLLLLLVLLSASLSVEWDKSGRMKWLEEERRIFNQMKTKGEHTWVWLQVVVGQRHRRQQFQSVRWIQLWWKKSCVGGCSSMQAMHTFISLGQ